MTDLAKILLSGGIGWVGGVISGIFLEPFKSWYVRKHTAKRAQKEIYRELANFYDLFYLSKMRTDEGFCHHALKYNPPDTFDYYFEEHRESCFLIPGWNGLKGFYEVYKVARDVALRFGYQPKERPGQNVALVRNIGEEFIIRFEKGQLDKARILSASKAKPTQ